MTARRRLTCCALSASVDFPEDGQFDLIYLSGGWSREANLTRRRLEQGTTALQSRRGMSSHQHNPFAALAKPGTDEHQGEVYGFPISISMPTSWWRSPPKARSWASSCLCSMTAGSASPPRRSLLLSGLNPDYDYTLTDSGEVFGGDRLMQAGLALPDIQQDYVSGCFRLRAQP